MHCSDSLKDPVKGRRTQWGELDCRQPEICTLKKSQAGVNISKGSHIDSWSYTHELDTHTKTHIMPFKEGKRKAGKVVNFKYPYEADACACLEPASIRDVFFLWEIIWHTEYFGEQRFWKTSLCLCSCLMRLQNQNPKKVSFVLHTIVTARHGRRLFGTKWICIWSLTAIVCRNPDLKLWHCDQGISKLASLCVEFNQHAQCVRLSAQHPLCWEQATRIGRVRPVSLTYTCMLKLWQAEKIYI